MRGIPLSVAIGDYDRNRAIIDGRVSIDGVEPIVMTLTPEEIFFRAMRHEAFDVCELSLGSHALRTDRGDSSYVGVPAFVSRAFRHTSIIVRRASGLRSLTQLEGCRVGLGEWQLTANVWARALIAEQGVDLGSITWLRGGIDEPDRMEKVAFVPPASLRIEDIGAGKTLGRMLLDGEVDALMGPRLPQAFVPDHPEMRWLLEDPTTEAQRYFERTRIFPIMHLIGIRRRLVEKHPWLPSAVLKAFESARRIAMQQLADTSATKVMLPFVEERLAMARRMMGADFWSYGVAPNRHVLEAFLSAHRAQGLSTRTLSPEDLFHASTLEAARV